jgi:hypothetical protein
MCAFLVGAPRALGCSWDHWVADVAVCNAAGLWLGMHTLRTLQMLQYDWTGREAQQPVSPSLVSRLMRQFTPYEFARYEWRLFDSATHLFAAVLLIIMLVSLALGAHADITSYACASCVAAGRPHSVAVPASSARACRRWWR